MLFWVACGFFSSLALLIAFIGITCSALEGNSSFKKTKLSRNSREDYYPTLSGTITPSSFKADPSHVLAEE